ncbi:hypothetical protein AAXB25_22670 [Paenibacillus lautus]|uniref:hypothetical protein n=1 Tax=Paenibacillus lautus TaxID=1401 RepID=UPI003D289D37
MADVINSGPAATTGSEQIRADPDELPGRMRTGSGRCKPMAVLQLQPARADPCGFG